MDAAGETAPSAKRVLQKHKDLGSIPRAHVKWEGVVACTPVLASQLAYLASKRLFPRK